MEAPSSEGCAPYQQCDHQGGQSVVLRCSAHISTVRISRDLNDIFSETVELTSGSGSARIVEFDIVTRDGVIHAIDTLV